LGRGADGENGRENTLEALRPQHLLQVPVGPRKGAELAKVDFAVFVGVYALHDALDLSVAVRQRMLAHEAGEAALAHAALALVLGAGGDGGEVGMLVKLAPQLRFIHAAER